MDSARFGWPPPMGEATLDKSRKDRVMAGNSYLRNAKLEPWYHQSAPQCMATTIAEYQCLFTARYEATDGKHIFLCKTHAFMYDGPVKLMTPKRVQIRDA